MVTRAINLKVIVPRQADASWFSCRYLEHAP